jgi:Delta-aminolevulinic acid dehydratase
MTRTESCSAPSALSHARAGAGMVAPSGMMDGRMWAIRPVLVLARDRRFARSLWLPLLADTRQRHHRRTGRHGRRFHATCTLPGGAARRMRGLWFGA